MHRVAPIVCLLAVAACGGPHMGDDDGGVDGAMGGLIVQFQAPDLGQPVGDITVSRLVLNAHDLRAINDTTPPTLDAAQISLDGEDTPTVRFDDVSPGNYSALKFDVAKNQDGESSWQMDGTVVTDAQHPFQVEDEQSLSISLPLSFALAPGETATITVDVDVAAIPTDVDWTQVELTGEGYSIEHDSSQMDGLRNNLQLSFSIADQTVQ